MNACLCLEDAPGADIPKIMGYGEDALPVVPTRRCRRCGCWLNSRNHEEYCNACFSHIKRIGRDCPDCGALVVNDDLSIIRCSDCEDRFRRESVTCSCGASFVPYGCMKCGISVNDVCPSCHWHNEHAGVSAEKVCAKCGASFPVYYCRGCGKRQTAVCEICHMEAEHPENIAVIWTMPDCPVCAKVKTAIRRQRYLLAAKLIRDLLSGDEPDADALAELALHDFKAPLVKIGGRFLTEEEIAELANGSVP